MKRKISISISAFLLVIILTFEMLPQSTDEINIVIKKSARSLQVFKGRNVLKHYAIALGYSPKGDKQIEGDSKTPLGEFYVFTKNDQSKFHLSLGLSYPNDEDAKRGLAKGLINQEQYDQIIEAIRDRKMPPQNTALGGEIYIHGGGTDGDWTQGCVALSNPDIDELFEMVTVGTRVTIRP
jgi:murein L,D-transpeptidase YafK